MEVMCTGVCLLLQDPCVCVLLLQDLLQSCARGGRRRVEDMCYERRRAEACVDESAHHALCVFITAVPITKQNCSRDMYPHFWGKNVRDHPSSSCHGRWRLEDRRWASALFTEPLVDNSQNIRITLHACQISLLLFLAYLTIHFGNARNTRVSMWFPCADACGYAARHGYFSSRS